MKYHHPAPSLKTLSIILFTAFFVSVVEAAPKKKNLKLPQVTIAHDSLTLLYGNALVEKLQEEGSFEASMQAASKGKRLQFRTMAYVGDQVGFRIRPEKFSQHQAYLVDQWRSNRVIMAFGGNESYQGEQGIEPFKEQLRSYLEIITSRHPNNQYYFCSPIAAEQNSRILDLKVEKRNQNLKLYTEAIAEVVSENNISFINLFTPTLALFQNTDGKYTTDGIHLNDLGASKVGPILAQGILGKETLSTIDFSQPGFASLKSLVNRKAYEVAQSYHPSNGISYYGTRTRNYEYVAEIPHHLKLANQLDQAIWQQAQNLSQIIAMPKLEVLHTKVPSSKPRNGLGIVKSSQDDLKDFKMADDYEVSCFASSEDFPELINPLQINFDTRGRLWVTCFASYPHPFPGAQASDTILIFEDVDGDGKADKKTVFADNLLLPDGFVLYGKGALVSVSKKLLYLEDTDGDDVADVREEILRGFDNTDTHHSGYLSRSPRGDLIMSEALFHRGQFEALNGVVHTKDTCIMSLDLDTRHLTVERQTSAPNPWKVTYNSYGAAIQFYGGGQIIDADIYNIHAPMGNAAPGGLGYPFRYDKGCSAQFVESPHFPKEWQGGLITSHLLKTNEINFTPLKYVNGAYKSAGKKLTLMKSKNKIFRPSDLCFGIDGSLYISDFYYPIIGHAQHSNRDKNRDYSNGRIWRVTHKKNKPLTTPQIAGTNIEHLIHLLTNPHLKIRQLARLELERHPKSEVIEAIKIAKDSLSGSDLFSLEILWLMERLKTFDDPSLIKNLLASENLEIKRAAIRSLRWWQSALGSEFESTINHLATDKDPRVQILLVGLLSRLQLQDNKWSTVIANLEAKDQTPLAFAKEIASWKERPSLAPEFPLLKIEPKAYLTKDSFSGNISKQATLYFKSTTAKEWILGHANNPYLSLSLNDKPVVTSSGSPHTTSSQSSITVQVGINKIDLKVSEKATKRRIGEFAVYLCDKAGNQPKGLLLATSESQSKEWTSDYAKALEENWEDFAKATFQKHCANCHAIETKAVGPALKGLLGKTQTVIMSAGGEKKEVTIDREYLRNSIIAPMSVYPEGQVPAMPKLPLSDREVNTLVRWIESL